MPDFLTRFKRGPLPRLIYRAAAAYLWVRKPVTIGVHTLVEDTNGRVLLIRHTYRPGWMFPGGGVNKWERFDQAAIRETREEAGVAIEALDGMVGLYANFNRLRCDHVALFRASRWQSVPVRSVEIAEAGFFPRGDLPPETTSATLRRLAEVYDDRPIDGVW